MGRYTSVQVFTDQNTKVLAEGYKGAGEDGSNRPKLAQCEKVETVMGSCAGAGSEQFHIYRAARRRELDRLQGIELKAAADAATRVFVEKVERNKREAEERTKKNAEKRKKKREKKRIRKRCKTEGKDDLADEPDELSDDSSSEVSEVPPSAAEVS